MTHSKLGHSIPGPDEPDIEPFNVASYIPAPAPLPSMFKTGFSSSRSRLLVGELGFWAQVMATIDPHASAGFHRSSDDEINVREIEAHTFQPSMNYITQSIAELDVASFLEQTRYKVPVYMITGLDIARGASPRSNSSSSRSINASGWSRSTQSKALKWDPVQSLRTAERNMDSFEDSSDFVARPFPHAPSACDFPLSRTGLDPGSGTARRVSRELRCWKTTTRLHRDPRRQKVLGLEDEAGELP